ncbi:related to 6-hydroxy-D-nicotine oxidase [Cephalotrichum gorgonifer]|uniref:Related to 6-hydroxy-D-nicotine oxidase n=1 Tax=Cephalotrichum gorgonifer TaxID=2041049 RepID=A0AAE8SZU8_9PEZI|nr:related to 6-hydroxy-D-nicotine oxidase [Cephalotrichum gorgonifer]
MLADQPKLSAKATFRIPGPEDTPASLLDRWSNTYISLPAAVAVPDTEADIAALITYAKEHDLSILVAGGKHFASVPITPKTLYVDMSSFNSIHIDEQAQTVTIGGGVTTGAVLDALTTTGYYTSVPNTNTVGFVGAFLGGGSSTFNSVKGFLIDDAVSARVVTAAGKTLTLGQDSEGDEAALWHALRGAGHGLAVVTSLTVRIYPISELRMDDDKIWSRMTLFAPPAFGIAARTFAKLQPVRGPIALNLIITRSPPGTPAPGAPVLMLMAAYFGPSAEAEKALAALLDPEVVGAAVMATTALIPVNGVNSGTKPAELRGGLKRSEATLLKEPVSATTIESVCARFLQLGREFPDTTAGGSAVVFYAFDSSTLEASGVSEAARLGFFEGRNARCIVYHDIWFREEGSAEAVDAYLPDAIAIARASETGPLRRFANFMRHPANLAESYSEAKITEKKRVKDLWDPENVFWTPGFDRRS